MNKTAEITAVGGAKHAFRFCIGAEEPSYVELASNPAFSLRAQEDKKPLGATTVIVGETELTLGVIEHHFGPLVSDNIAARRCLGNIMLANRIGKALNPSKLHFVVSSPLGAVAAYKSGLGPREDFLPYGWPLGFRNVFDLSGETPQIVDQYATGVLIPRPNPHHMFHRDAYKSSLPPRPTRLLNAMKDEVMVQGTLVPRTEEPLALDMELSNLGTTDTGIPFITGWAAGLTGLESILSLPEDTSLIVYSDVYRLAQMLRMPPELLQRLFIGGQTLRGANNTQLQSFEGLAKIHHNNLAQTCKIGF